MSRLLTANLQFQRNLPGLKRRQAKDRQEKKGRYTGRSEITRACQAHGGYEKETVENEQESTIDITV